MNLPSLQRLGCLQSDTRFHTVNPLVNQEDLQDHAAVAGIFLRGKGVLTFFHKKYQFTTIPMGKGKPEVTPITALSYEMVEELGVSITNCELIGQFKKSYYRGGNTSITIDHYLYLITEYKGDICNMEEDKHSHMQFVNISTLRNLNPMTMSCFLRFFTNIWGY